MALLAKLAIISYPEAFALTDQEEKFLVEELKINLLTLALRDESVQKSLKEQMSSSVKSLRAGKSSKK